MFHFAGARETNLRQMINIPQCHVQIQLNFADICMNLLESLSSFSVALPAEPRGEKKLFFVQILGGEKLLKFGENGR